MYNLGYNSMIKTYSTQFGACKWNGNEISQLNLSNIPLSITEPRLKAEEDNFASLRSWLLYVSDIVRVEAETLVGSLSHYGCFICQFQPNALLYPWYICSNVVYLLVTSTSMLPMGIFWGWLMIRKTSISQSWGSDCGFSHWHFVISGWGGGLRHTWGSVTRLNMTTGDLQDCPCCCCCHESRCGSWLKL